VSGSVCCPQQYGWINRALSANALLDGLELDGLELDGTASCAVRQLRATVADVLAACREHDVEGIIAKRVDSPYRPAERSSDWLKVKTADWRTAHASQRHRH
jgi:hypothetical protein